MADEKGVIEDAGLEDVEVKETEAGGATEYGCRKDEPAGAAEYDEGWDHDAVGGADSVDDTEADWDSDSEAKIWDIWSFNTRMSSDWSDGCWTTEPDWLVTRGTLTAAREEMPGREGGVLVLGPPEGVENVC